ncbi:MAG: rhodanese-like domain-containing protein [Gemmatimonadaceae bacterium]
MIFKRLYDDTLAQASYLLGCTQTGEAIIVDPNRDIEKYVRAAEGEGLRITHVTETHIHADFVSGSRELAEQTGSRLFLSDEGDSAWKYAFGRERNVQLVTHGGSFKVGNILIDILHTPGHTPEHLSYMVTDSMGADSPIGILTGDFVFVGDVGRPDLLERAAKQAGTMESAARRLFSSIQKFKDLPDFLQIWPGHGAGSACGKSLGAMPQSTVGYEKIANWALGITNENEFVMMVLSGQPEPPTYFARMKHLNRDGPPPLGGLRSPKNLFARDLPAAVDSGALVVDVRSSERFAERHVPGTINIPLGKKFSTWAGSLVPYDIDFYILVDEDAPHAAEHAAYDLALIGLERVAGSFMTDAIDAWNASGRPIGTVPQMKVTDLATKSDRDEVFILDVRNGSEWEAGHMPNAANIPLALLTERLSEIPTDRPIVVHCQTGGRSSIAASVIRRSGILNVINLVGGYAGWVRDGHPIQHEGEELASHSA